MSNPYRCSFCGKYDYEVLLAFDVSAETREVWKREVKRHLRYLSGLRIKPDAKMVPERDIRRWLYGDPFDGHEAGYTAALIGLNSDEYPRNGLSDRRVAERVEAFWIAAVPWIAAGRPPVELVEAVDG